MSILTYKYGFSLSQDADGIYLNDVLNSPSQATFVLDQDYNFVINSIYDSEIITINSIKVDKCSNPCKGTVNSTLMLYPEPGVDLAISAISTFTVSITDSTNVSYYYFEHVRAGTVLQTINGVLTIDASTDFTAVIVGDYIRGGVVLSNGVKLYKEFQVVDQAPSPWDGITSGVRVDDSAAYTMNSSRDTILLTDTSFGISDGVWSVKVTVNYLDPFGDVKELSYTKCVLVDNSTDIGCKIFDCLTGDVSNDMIMLAQYEALKLAVNCDKCCEAYTIWESLIGQTNNCNCKC